MSTADFTATPTPQQVPIEPRETTDATPAPVEKSTPKEEPKPEPKQDKPDLDTAIKRAFEKANERKEADKAKEPAPAKDAAKPEGKTEEPKPAREREADGRFVSKEPKTPEPSASTAEPAGSEQAGETKPRPSEGRDYTKPPAHFLPRAKEAWANVNPDVQGEVHRMAENYEKGIAEYRESHEFRKELKQYEDMAKAEGTTLKEALGNFARIQGLLRTNPAEGIQRVLASINVTPQQYAQHILGQAQQQRDNPQGTMNSQLQQTIASLNQKITQMEERDRQREEENRLRQVADRFIEPFKQDHPRYDELEGDIAFFLNSGKIPSNLSERERLEAAYDMAERINPAPKFGATREPGTQATVPRPLDPAGTKSVTGSPTPGLSTTRAPGKEEAKDLDAILRRSLAKATAR